MTINDEHNNIPSINTNNQNKQIFHDNKSPTKDIISKLKGRFYNINNSEPVLYLEELFGTVKSKIEELIQEMHIFQPKEKEENKGIVEVIWKDETGNKAKETIERINTVDLMKTICKKEIAYLKVEKEKNIQSRIIIKKGKNPYAERMNNLTRSIMEYNKEMASWANSNYFRDKLRGRLTGNLDSIKSEYKSSIKNYLPLPINMRVHSCEVYNKEASKSENSALVRLGVISDMRNGFTNLKELKKLQFELQNGYTENLSNVRKTICLKAEKEHKKGHTNALGSAVYALEEIRDLDAIQSTLEKRRNFLTLQALPLIVEQANKANLNEIDVLKMIDVRLLNHKSETIDEETGWCHNEANELLDMAEIFKELSEKKLICDGLGPFIDDEGHIHLPQKIETALGQPKTIELFAAVVNHSVQIYTKNDGVTREVNLETLSRIHARFPKKKHEDLTRLVIKKQTGFMSAINLIDFLKNKGYSVSTGCLSAKDRTGFVCAGWVVLKRMACFSTQAKLKIMRKQLKAGFPAVETVRENTKAKSLKVAFFLPWVTDYPLGFISRIGNIAQLLIDTHNEAKRRVKKTNPPVHEPHVKEVHRKKKLRSGDLLP